MKAKIALADDHVMLRNGLASLLKDIGYDVLFEADNGKDLISKLNGGNIPDIVIMDINMPVMDGYETTLFLKKNHPKIRVLALSMYDDDNTIIRMLKNGAKGYILKDSDPSELRLAIQSVLTKGYYQSDLVANKLFHTFNHHEELEASQNAVAQLSNNEVEFLKLACTEMTYKEIAEQMNVSARTVDGYRDSVYEKLRLKSRVGLVIYAIKNGIVKI